MSRVERKLKREAMRRWRERHPVLAAWHAHLWNAKKRGIEIKWTLDEFSAFCAETGYHILRRDGWQIHRNGDIGPYALDRVFLVKSEINRWLQDLYRQRASGGF
jgi:hypothetical protein